jgi:hypothetical protein
MYQVGDRVKVTVKGTAWLKHVKNAPATIVHIDNQALYQHHFCPIQVELEEPYDDSGQAIIRVCLREIKPLIEDENLE